MSFCRCGAQASYPHQADCPRPLFTEASEEVRRWERERATRRVELAAPLMLAAIEQALTFIAEEPNDDGLLDFHDGGDGTDARLALEDAVRIARRK